MATNTAKKTTRPAAATAAKDKPAAVVAETVETPTVAPVVTEQATEPTASEVEAVKPVSAPPSRPADQRIMSIAATIMIEFPENGATETELVAHTGIDAAELAQLLSAMANADAAVKVSWAETDGGETVRWTLGSVKPSQVDPANLPACPTCGIVPPPIRANGSVKRTNATGGARGGVNADGKPTLKPGELADMVKGLIAEHEGVKLTSTEIAKELSIRHDRTIGASSVAYTIDAMLKKNELTTDPRK